MIYSLGESLVDIIIDDKGLTHLNPGGSMLNTSVSLARAGTEVALISETGDDPIAKTILTLLQNNKVGTSYIKKYFRQNTTIALAFLDERKIPVFSVYSSYPRKRKLIAPASFSCKDFLLFGSLYSINQAIRNEVTEIIANAKRGEAIISYDPNIRQHDCSPQEFKKSVYENIAFSDIVKASDEDLLQLFGEHTDDGYYEQVRKINPSAIFILTKGEKGAVGYFQTTKVPVGAQRTNIVSTVGAGDAFHAGCIQYLFQNKIEKKQLDGLSEEVLSGMLQRGNYFSSLVCSSPDNYLPANSL